jgi:hypothetical protein
MSPPGLLSFNFIKKEPAWQDTEMEIITLNKNSYPDIMVKSQSSIPLGRHSNCHDQGENSKRVCPLLSAV